MKKLIVCWLLSFFFITIGHAQYHNSQYRSERTGYEGDYFSLEGALHVFKESNTLRDFERKINSKENWVNNLDLNYDGRIDYIRVEHRQRGNYHAIILQALVDRYDVQDVAVIEIEVIGRGEAILQIVGDEDLYGEEVFVEPVEGYANGGSRYHPDFGDYVNVYYWRPVQYILDRQYRPYVSTYSWGYYPTWWNPWRQYSWNVFRPRIVVYHNYYYIAPRHRVVRVHNFYRPYRSYCNSVVQRSNNVRVKQGRAPVYRNPTVGQGRGDSQANERNRSIENSRRSSGSSIYSGQPRNNPSIDRNRTQPSPEHDNIRTRSPQINPKSRNDENNRERSGSTIYSGRSDQRPSLSRSRTPQANPKSGNSESRSRVYQPSRNEQTRSSTPTRSRTTTRSTTPAQKPTIKSRSTAPTSKPSVSRSTSSKSRSNSSGSSRKRTGNE